MHDDDELATRGDIIDGLLAFSESLNPHFRKIDQLLAALLHRQHRLEELVFMSNQDLEAQLQADNTELAQVVQAVVNELESLKSQVADAGTKEISPDDLSSLESSIAALKAVAPPADAGTPTDTGSTDTTTTDTGSDTTPPADTTSTDSGIDGSTGATVGENAGEIATGDDGTSGQVGPVTDTSGLPVENPEDSPVPTSEPGPVTATPGADGIDETTV